MTELNWKRVAQAIDAATLIKVRPNPTEGAYVSKESLVNFLVQAFKENDYADTFDEWKFRQACYKNWARTISGPD